MFCKDCLKQMLQKLNDNDIIIAELLQKENAIIPQCSLSWQAIFDKVGESEKMSANNVYTSLKRLNEFGFIETQKWTRKNKYYITMDGVNLLQLVEQNMG